MPGKTQGNTAIFWVLVPGPEYFGPFSQSHYIQLIWWGLGWHGCNYSSSQIYDEADIGAIL